MNANFRLVAALLAVFGTAPALACFTVYDKNNNVVYNAKVPPVDMSQPLSESLSKAYPGGHMVFGSGASCPAENTAGRTRLTSPRGKAPLLTDASTAQSLGLKHTMIRNNVAVVAETPDDMPNGVMIAESGRPSAADDTRSMGAGPAPQMRAKPATVITEMHNPPLTAVQRGR